MSYGQNIPQCLHVAQAPGWSISHRINSALPGYLMIASTKATNDLSDLSTEALSSIGLMFATVRRALTALGAQRIYFGRYGHAPGYPVHLHAIPIYDWVEELFWKDDRYQALEQFADGPGKPPTDGAELTLFVWREFCERTDPSATKGSSVAETIAILRQTIQF